MGKRKSKGNVNKSDNKKIDSRTEIDYEKLAEAIVLAQKKVKELEEQEEENKELSGNKWSAVRGYKQCTSSNGFKKIIYHIRNAIVIIFNILFLTPKLTSNDANDALIRFIYKTFMKLIKWGFYGLSIFLFGFAIYSIVNKQIPFVILGFLYSYGSYLFGRMFQFAIVEIEYIEDKNYVVSLFSSLASFIAMILALIALFVSKK